jgi:hypothetical protein
MLKKIFNEINMKIKEVAPHHKRGRMIWLTKGPDNPVNRVKEAIKQNLTENKRPPQDGG